MATRAAAALMIDCDPPTLSNGPRASLFMFDDRIAWSSISFHGGRTQRPACALLLGVEQPLRLTTAQKVWRSRALLVGPDVARSLSADGAGFYSLTLDPAHPANRYLRDEVLAGREVLDLRSRCGPELLARGRAAIAGHAGCAESLHASEWMLGHFFPGLAAATAIEPRVAQVAAWLRRHVPPRARMADLSAVCGLSPGRLTHLFTQELGVSIRSYLRWAKMCRAIELLGQRQSVTEVAAAIGFADAAHFTRVLRSYYSAAPSFILNRELVQVHACSESPLRP